jgi:hypothetical protein
VLISSAAASAGAEFGQRSASRRPLDLIVAALFRPLRAGFGGGPALLPPRYGAPEWSAPSANACGKIASDAGSELHRVVRACSDVSLWPGHAPAAATLNARSVTDDQRLRCTMPFGLVGVHI